MYSLVEIGILNAITAGALALFVLAISRWLRRPALIHALWVLVLLKFVTPPLVEIPVGLRLERLASITTAKYVAIETATESRPTALATSPIVINASAAQVDQAALDEIRQAADAATIETRHVASTMNAVTLPSLHRWIAVAAPIVLCSWAAGTIVWFIIQGWRIVLFVRLAATARLAPEEVQQQTRQLASSLGARRAPAVWILDATMSPILWSMGSRARVIFPADLLERVDADARATLLTHELAHYHRGDHWVRLLEFVVTGLFWWHPAVWFARREIEVAEEHCCDAWVVAQFPDQPRRYAEALLDTIDFLSEHRPRVAPVATGLGQVPFLRERIRLIMSGVAPKSMSGSTRLAVLAAAAVLLPIGPELFDGAIRRADAALETLDQKASAELALSTLLEEPNIATTPTVENVDNRVAASRQLLEGLEDDLIDILTPEVAAWAVVNSPDGRFQAVAKANGSLVVSDTFQRKAFDLTKYQVSSIAFVPHRDLLAAGSSDSKLYLFDCASGEPVTTFTGHNAAIASVAVSLDGQFVVSGSRDGAVKLWDIDYEKEVPSRVPNHASAINCVRFSPDGRLLAIASGDWLTADAGTVLLWDLRGGTTKQQFETSSPVGAIAIGSDKLVTVEWNGRSTTWDLQSGAIDASTMIGKDTVSAASFAADAQSMLLSATDDQQSSATTPAWFQRMDRDQDGRLAWTEFQGPRGTFRKLDVDADEIVTSDELGTVIQ